MKMWLAPQQQAGPQSILYSSNFESFRFTHSFVLVNLHNDCCHVVTANPLAGGDIARAALVEQLPHAIFHLLHCHFLLKVVAVQSRHQEVYRLLACLDVPDAVARQNDELCLRVDWLDAHVREG